METRRLLSSAALYGLADIATLAVGGFLLLPLYTRTLGPQLFGTYVAVRANADIFTYLLQLGLPSGVSRVYFDYKQHGDEYRFLSSVVLFFCIFLCATLGLLWGVGNQAWALLSPAVPAQPYLGFAVLLGTLSFFGAIATLWLRLDGRAGAFVALQLASAGTLAVSAVIGLLALNGGLGAVLTAISLAAACTAGALPVLFGRRFHWHLRWTHVRAVLPYALPILVGYLAHFTLNKFSTLVLQRHVALGDVGTFGVAQQLASIVSLACASFGMALQPSVFAAPNPAAANALLDRAARLLVGAVFAVAALLILFTSELLSLVAPHAVTEGRGVMMALVVANAGTAFILISDTALLYYRRPTVSVAISIISAGVSAACAFWLIPLHLLTGAAASVMAGVLARTLLSHWLAYRQSRYRDLVSLGLVPLMLSVLALGVASLESFPSAWRWGIKLSATAGVFALAYLVTRRRLASYIPT
jgi:O-antigen/teichoic acid export membrane protein